MGEASSQGDRAVTLGLTDLGNAHRFIERHGQNVRRVTVANEWLIWNEQRWQVDDTGAVYRLACETVRSIWKEIPDAATTADKADLAMHAKRSESERSIKSLLAIASNHESVVVRPSDLDANPLLFAVENGVIDLDNLEFRPAQREDLITKVAGVAYDPEATAPEWDCVLEQILPDKEVRDYLQRSWGAALTGKPADWIQVNIGGGANGKGVVSNTHRSMMGDYAVDSAIDTFMERSDRGARTDVARLEKARVVLTEEAAEGRRLDEALIKEITGGGRLTARHLYQAERSFLPEFKLFLNVNHRPVIRGTDYAIWRRIHMVHFPITIAEEDRDPDLSDKLKLKLAGILNWTIAGYEAWKETGLQPPLAVRSATEEYRKDSDIMGTFIAENCVLDPAATVAAKELYTAYREWAIAANERPISSTAFGIKLSDRGLAKSKNGTVSRLGIRLRDANEANSGQSGQMEALSVNRFTARAKGELPELGKTVQPSNNHPETLSPKSEARSETIPFEREAEYLARVGAA